MIDITNPKKAIKVNVGGSTIIRKAANRERPVRINLSRREGSMLMFNNYSFFSLP
jgi:hypothetical protein